MKEFRLYLDTSIPSAYYDKHLKERQTATIKFWTEVLPNYQVCISEITIEELNNTKDELLRKNLGKLVRGFKLLKINGNIRRLAKVYIEKGIFPEKYINDALHVAVASFYLVPYIVSWNFEHLVKVKTRKLVNFANILEGFREIEIVSPPEL